MMMRFQVLLCFFISVTFTKCDDRKIYTEETYQQILQQMANRRNSITSQTNDSVTMISFDDVESRLANAIINMTLKILKYSHHSLEFQNLDHVVFGPLTIFGALSVTLLGSIDQTHTELVNFLELSTMPNIETDPIAINLHIGNLLKKLNPPNNAEEGVIKYGVSIFHQHDFEIRPEFRDFATNFYQADLIEVDFRSHSLDAQQLINGWVFNRTNGKIPKLFNSPPSTSTNVIITSVLYFKANWEYPFIEGYTKSRPFYSNGRNQPSDKTVQMMTNGGEFPYFRIDNYHLEMIGLPYKGGRVTMYVLISEYTTRQNISDLEQSLNIDFLKYCIEQATPTDSIVLFPKMRLETSVNLRSTLQNAGVRSLFNPYESNLSLMTSGKVSSTPSRISSYPRQVEKNSKAIHGFTDSEGRMALLSDCDSNSYQNDTSRCFQLPLPNTPVSDAPNNYNDNTHSNMDPLNKLRLLEQQFKTNPQRNPGLYVDEVIHKVFIDVNEKGTEAAAATGLSLNRSGGRVMFKVDVPFIFFMYDSYTKTILFWGSVKSPPNIGHT